jgi:hypothetical protein
MRREIQNPQVFHHYVSLSPERCTLDHAKKCFKCSTQKENKLQNIIYVYVIMLYTSLL